MLAADFALEGFEPDDWVRLLQLTRSAGDAQTDSGPGLIAIAQENELYQLWRTDRGAVADQGDWPTSLKHLCAIHGAAWAVRLKPPALGELSERFAARLSSKDTLQDQWVSLMVALQELVHEDQVAIWPRYLFNWPTLVAENVMRSSFELLCPPAKSLALGVFDAGQLYVGLVVQRGERDIERVIGPRALAGPMGLLSGDWLRDYPHLIRAAQTECGPVAGGCFTELSTLRRLSDSETPGALTQAVAARDVVLDPISPALAVSLGFDVGRAALLGMQSLTRRISRSAIAQHPALQRVKSAARFDGGVDDWLKLDPLAALARLLNDRRED